MESKSLKPKLRHRLQAKLTLWARVWGLSKQLLKLDENQLQRAEWLVDSERDLADMRRSNAQYIKWLMSGAAKYDRMDAHYPKLDEYPWEKDNG